MNKKEFKFLLKQGEGLKLEFKENFDSPACACIHADRSARRQEEY